LIDSSNDKWVFLSSDFIKSLKIQVRSVFLEGNSKW